MEEGPSAAEHAVIEQILDGIEYVAVAIELVAVAVIAVGVFYAIFMFMEGRRQGVDGPHQEVRFRARLGKSLLVGLEILVAADIIRTVALEPTLTNVGILAILVLVRTFLSWSLVVEVEGHWPWKRPAHAEEEEEAAEMAEAL